MEVVLASFSAARVSKKLRVRWRALALEQQISRRAQHAVTEDLCTSAHNLDIKTARSVMERPRGIHKLVPLVRIVPSVLSTRAARVSNKPVLLAMEPHQQIIRVAELARTEAHLTNARRDLSNRAVCVPETPRWTTKLAQCAVMWLLQLIPVPPELSKVVILARD